MDVLSLLKLIPGRGRWDKFHIEQFVKPAWEHWTLWLANSWFDFSTMFTTNFWRKRWMELWKSASALWASIWMSAQRVFWGSKPSFPERFPHTKFIFLWLHVDVNIVSCTPPKIILKCHISVAICSAFHIGFVFNHSTFLVIWSCYDDIRMWKSYPSYQTTSVQRYLIQEEVCSETVWMKSISVSSVVLKRTSWFNWTFRAVMLCSPSEELNQLVLLRTTELTKRDFTHTVSLQISFSIDPPCKPSKT